MVGAMKVENDPAFDELGRRILAALMSYQLGYSGVDRTLKELREGGTVIDPSWNEVGLALLRRMQDIQDANRLPPHKA